MIFMCFSGRDRLSIVRSVLYHLENYGLNVWYDNHQYILGDHKVNNYTEAIRGCRYAVVILSRHFFDSAGAIEELVVIKQQHEIDSLHIFPILYDLCADDTPNEYNWLLDLIYNELNQETGSLLTCNQILCKILSDEIKNNRYLDFRSISDFHEISTQDQHYIRGLIVDYEEIIRSNIIGRLAMLHSLAMFAQCRLELADYYIKSIRYLFSTTKLNITYDFKEIEIMEYLVTILLNKLIQQRHQLFD